MIDEVNKLSASVGVIKSIEATTLNAEGVYIENGTLEVEKCIDTLFKCTEGYIELHGRIIK